MAPPSARLPNAGPRQCWWVQRTPNTRQGVLLNAESSAAPFIMHGLNIPVLLRTDAPVLLPPLPAACRQGRCRC